MGSRNLPGFVCWPRYWRVFTRRSYGAEKFSCSSMLPVFFTRSGNGGRGFYPRAACLFGIRTPNSGHPISPIPKWLTLTRRYPFYTACWTRTMPSHGSLFFIIFGLYGDFGVSLARKAWVGVRPYLAAWRLVSRSMSFVPLGLPWRFSRSVGSPGRSNRPFPFTGAEGARSWPFPYVPQCNYPRDTRFWFT